MKGDVLMTGPLTLHKSHLNLGDWLVLLWADIAARAAWAAGRGTRLWIPLDGVGPKVTHLSQSKIAGHRDALLVELGKAGLGTETDFGVVDKPRADALCEDLFKTLFELGVLDTTSASNLQRCAQHGLFPQNATLDQSDRRQQKQLGRCPVCKAPTQTAHGRVLALNADALAAARAAVPAHWDSKVLDLQELALSSMRILPLATSDSATGDTWQLCSGVGLAAAHLRQLADNPGPAHWLGCPKNGATLLVYVRLLGHLVLGRDAFQSVVTSASCRSESGNKLPEDLPDTMIAAHGLRAFRLGLATHWSVRTGGQWNPAHIQTANDALARGIGTAQPDQSIWADLGQYRNDALADMVQHLDGSVSAQTVFELIAPRSTTHEVHGR
ncbi:MAG: hypothetical protein ABJI96_23495 [Paracoccaceae bacterium]